MIDQLRIAWVAAALLVAALLVATASTLVSPVAVQASDDDPAGVCIHVRRVDPHNEYCVWLTRAT